MPKILIFGTTFLMIYNHRLELINQLKNEGFEVVIAAPVNHEDQLVDNLHCRVIDISIQSRGTNILQDIRLVNSLRKIIKTEHPDVVLTFYTKTNIYGGIACRITNTPYIENITGLGSALSKNGILQHITAALYREGVRKANAIFFQNYSNREFFHNHNIRKNFGILLPGSGVSLERFPLLPYPKDGTIEFLFLSRLLKEKGIDEYLEAAEIIKKEFKNVNFHVAGPMDEDYDDKINKAVEKGIITYHGLLFNVKPLIEKTHCTVFPSYYAEGMANVLLESAASGRPLITTRNPGCIETVDENKSGYLINSRDTMDLVDKIRKFILLPWEEKKEMGKAGRRKMENEFDRKLVVNQYINAINKIINSNKRTDK